MAGGDWHARLRQKLRARVFAITLMKRTSIAVLTLAILLPDVAQAQETERRRLTAEEALQWQAVGRLNIAGTRFCTATLIAPQLILTAAHCLFHPKTGKKVPLSEFRFVAGWRRGEYAAVRNASDAVAQPEFVPGKAALEGVEHDLALIRLRTPIRRDRIAPIDLTEPPGMGGVVTIVSYGRDRAQAPSIQSVCHMMRVDGLKAVVDCKIIQGASGAPVMVREGNGWRVTGVVSAMGRIFTGRDVTLIAIAGARVRALRRELEATSWPTDKPR